MSERTQPTHIYCPASGGKPGEDNTTHHMVPRGGRMVCRYCGKTASQIESESKR